MLQALSGFLSPMGRVISRQHQAPEGFGTVMPTGDPLVEFAPRYPARSSASRQVIDEYRALTSKVLPSRKSAGIVWHTSGTGKSGQLAALSWLLRIEEARHEPDLVVRLHSRSLVAIECKSPANRAAHKGYTPLASPLPEQDFRYDGQHRLGPPDGYAWPLDSDGREYRLGGRPVRRWDRRSRWIEFLRELGRERATNRSDARHVVRALRAVLENVSLALRVCGRRADGASCSSRTFPWTPLRSSATLHAPPNRDGQRLVTTKAGRVTPA